MPVNLKDKKRSYANYTGFVAAEGAPVAPVNTVAPALTGTAQAGQVLSVDTGTWTGNPVPTFEYRWFADGARIDGARAATCTLTADEVGAVVHATVIATNAASSVAADSNSTAAVIA